MVLRVRGFKRGADGLHHLRAPATPLRVYELLGTAHVFRRGINRFFEQNSGVAGKLDYIKRVSGVKPVDGVVDETL